MKTLKMTLVAAMVTALTINFSQAQEGKQMYTVHVDHVKPSMLMEYEGVCKELLVKCNEYNFEEPWLTLVTDDFDYFYVTPIDNMAELDVNPFAALAKKMGEKELGAMFQKMDKYYEDHVDYTIVMDKDLSYMPDGMTQTPAGKPFRKNTMYYFKPEHFDAAEQLAKDFKDLFTKKGSKMHYRVYRSGYGSDGTYFMVAVAAESPAAFEAMASENDALLGEEGQQLFGRLMGLISERKIISGYVRADLSYAPSN